MFRSKKKQKGTSTSQSASSSFNETSHVQTSSNGGRTSTIITRKISSQSSEFRSTEERSIHHSYSAGNVPQILPSSARSFLHTDTTPFTLGTGSASNPPLLGSPRLPPTALSSTFGTSFGSSPLRSSLPISSRSPALPRTAFGSTTVGSYPSRSRPPLGLSQNDAQNTTTATVPTYPNAGPKRGKALLINNIKFIDTAEERHGAKKDSDDLKNFLKMIGFEVEEKKNLKGQEMKNKVEQFSKTNFSKHDMSVIVIMSHGNNVVKNGDKLVRMKGGYTEIVGVDGASLLVDEIIEQFISSTSHSSLKGKPKIFIFQCCRGEKDQEVCHDVAPIKKVIKEHADILVAFSTLPGYLSNRNPETGSWYIQSICDVFKRHYKDHHIEDMLRIVDDQLSKKHPKYTQTSTFENRGFKRCYLHPQNEH